MDAIYRLVFTSRSGLAGTLDEQASAIANIVLASRRNNRHTGITGALGYEAGGFAQVLEGPRAAVEDTFARICRDARHRDVTVVQRGPAEAREFPDAPMALVDPPSWKGWPGDRPAAGFASEAPGRGDADDPATGDGLGPETRRDVEPPPGRRGAPEAAFDARKVGAALATAWRSTSVNVDLAVLGAAYAISLVSPDGFIRRASPSFLELFGYHADEVIGLAHSALLRQTPLLDDERAGITRALRQGEAKAMTCARRRKDGSELWVRALSIPILSKDGRLGQILEIATDVTDQYLKTLDDRGQVEAINTSQAVVHFALDGTILDANAHFLRAMGYGREEIVGQHHRMFVDPDEAASADYADFWRQLAAGTHQAAEFRRVGKTGAAVWLRATYNPIFDMEGRLRKIVKYAVDVTADRLQQAEYQWQLSAIHKSHAVISFDMHGTILEANDVFLSAMGYSFAEVEGRHHRMFVEPSYAHGPEYAAFWRSLASGRHQAGEYRRCGKHGREVWLQATYNPVFDAAGHPVKVVEFATIITEEKLRQAEYQGQIAAIHTSHCVVAFTLDGRLIDANDTFLDLLGYRLAELRGKPHSMLLSPDRADGLAFADLWAALVSGQHRATEIKVVGKDGREVWLQASYNPILDMSGRPFKVVQYAADITAQKSRQADASGQLAAIGKSQGVIVFGMDGTILEANENFLAMVGYGLDEIGGQHHRMLVEPDDAASTDYAAFWDTLREGRFVSGMCKRIGKDGREVWIQASYNPILDLNGRPFKIVKFASDVTSQVALAEAYEDAKRQAQHDPATSLPNRVRLAAFMDAVLAHPNRRLAILYIDLDRFKPVNDSYGHTVGDRVLGEFADRLRRSLANDQMAARVGGDEFVVAAPDLDDEHVAALCQRLRDTTAEPIRHEGGQIKVTASIGVAVSPQDGMTPDELMRCADIALCRAKQNGAGHFSFFAAETNDRIAAYRSLVDDMRLALKAGEFLLEFQPRFAAGGRGELRSAEALVRWLHPERGRISPAEFIPLAERSGLVVPLGEWVLRTACRAATAWGGVGVSVNVSAVQFRDTDVAEVVSAALAETGLPSHQLEIEITEGVLLDNAERARSTLDRLKRLGVRLAMDDFGTGYSSLSSLRSFPFDVIKVDRQFVSDIDGRPGGRAVMQAILALGRALELEVTAEGIETETQRAALIEDGCTELQGFLLARPMPAADLLRRLARPDAAVRRRAS